MTPNETTATKAPRAPTGLPGSAFACRTYHTGAGIEGAPSVDQIVAVLANL